MAYTIAQAQQQLLDTLGEATDAIGSALAALGVAYEQLDDLTADRLEAELFGPIQAAYGRAKRTYVTFADRYDLTTRPLAQPPEGGASPPARELVERAVGRVVWADDTLATLQDSLLPVEAGDPELRAGLTAVREQIGTLPHRARELLRTLGR